MTLHSSSIVLLCTLCLFTVLHAQPLTGYKTIGGTDPDYTTFAEATAALAANGIGTGGVIFLVRPGIYSERVVVFYHATMDSSHRVVFRNDMNYVGTVQLSPAVTASGQSAVIFSGCRYVTFNGISVIDTSTGTYCLYNGYWVSSFSTTRGSQYCTVKNATIRLRINSVYATNGIYQSRAHVAASPEGTQSYNTYLNLKISKVTNGMYISAANTYQDVGIEIGSDSAGVNYAKRFTIGAMENDTIGGGPRTAYGIYTNYVNGLSIHDIDICNMITYGNNHWACGMYLDNLNYSAGSLPTNVNNNRVYSLQAQDSTGYSYVLGIALFNRYNYGVCRIYNNMIYNLQTPLAPVSDYSPMVYGIYSNYLQPRIVNNTIVLGQNGIHNYSSACIFVNNFAGNDSLQNNIFANLTLQTSYLPSHYGIYNGGSYLKSDNNCFYIPNALGGYIGYSSGTECATLASWRLSQTPNQDLNSVSGNPFVIDSLNDLHIRTDIVTPVSNIGAPISWNTTDIDGESRSESTPDIGADEGLFLNRNLLASGTTMNFVTRKVNQIDSLMCYIYQPDRIPFRYTSISGLDTGCFSVRVLDTDSLTARYDTLRVRVYFHPDTNLAFRDTIRFAFEPNYTPITIPITGSATGSYVLFPSTNLNFSTTVTPGQSSALSFQLLTYGNDSLRNGRWITIPATAPFSVRPANLPTLPSGSCYPESLLFTPTTAGIFTAQLGLISDAVNGDTLLINVSGFSQTIPSAAGLSIVVNGENALLNWNRPDTTVQRYLVYFRDNPAISWQFLTSTTGYNATSFTHPSVVRFSPQMYYQVTAWYGGSTDSFDEIVREIPIGTSQAEVIRRLSEVDGIQSRPVEIRWGDR